ncbi:MAG: hypothetical protein QMO91_07380 [Candidatus Tisiphia sp.]|nr:hypothetical protein [Candidatus Tisiphia sp.]
MKNFKKYFVSKYFGGRKGSVASIIEDLLEATKLRFWTLCNH